MQKMVHGGDIYRNKNVVDFSSNCNPFGPPEGVKKAIKEAAEEIGFYPDVLCSELKDGLSESLNIKAENIVIGNGAADLIFSVVNALKPEGALLPVPSFAEYEQALKSAGCNLKYYELEESKAFEPGVEILNLMDEDTDIIFLCNPNNPTGVITERELLTKVLDDAKEKGIFVVLDECFLDFIDGGEELSFKKSLDEYPNLFILKAFTKLYAMAGVRLGYGLCSNENVMNKIASARQPWSVSNLAQKAGVAALKEKEYVKTCLEALYRERQWLFDELHKLGIKTFASKANYIFFKHRDTLYDECLEKGILIRDCGNYRNLEAGFYRIAVRTHEENEKLINTLKGLSE